jgi:hypothetical protein
MQAQLHIGKDCPAPELLEPITTLDYGWNKPNGGIWSSNYDTQTGFSVWVFAMIKAWGYAPNGAFDFRTTPRYVLEVDSNTRILTIASSADWQAVRGAYRMQKEYVPPALWPGELAGLISKRRNIAPLNFDRIAAEYDALYLTQSGYDETFDQPNGTFGWEAESTCWFRWCFTKVTDIGIGNL